MCKPMIVQDGYDEGLALYCKEHDTKQPVVDSEGRQAYQVDILAHIDMLIDHRAMYDVEKKVQE
jgi:hypothetical protein